jgi:hypothetical protein
MFTPDLNIRIFPSWIPDPHQRMIQDPDPDFLPIPDRDQKGTGTRVRIRNTWQYRYNPLFSLIILSITGKQHTVPYKNRIFNEVWYSFGLGFFLDWCSVLDIMFCKLGR